MKRAYVTRKPSLSNCWCTTRSVARSFTMTNCEDKRQPLPGHQKKKYLVLGPISPKNRLQKQIFCGCTPLRGHSRGLCRLDAPKALAGPCSAGATARWLSARCRSSRLPTAEPADGRATCPSLLFPLSSSLSPLSSSSLLFPHAMAPLRPAQAPSSR